MRHTRRALARPAAALLAALLLAPSLARAEDAATRTFTLVDVDGATRTDTAFRGKWLLVYFGYTHCPDACPTALTNMADLVDGLDPARRATIQPIFITVDPERDTPAVMKDFVGAFEGADIIGLTGTPDQVAAAERAFRVRSKRHVHGDGDYSMSHSSAIHVVAPDGTFAGFAYPDRLAKDVAALVR